MSPVIDVGAERGDFDGVRLTRHAHLRLGGQEEPPYDDLVGLMWMRSRGGPRGRRRRELLLPANRRRAWPIGWSLHLSALYGVVEASLCEWGAYARFVAPRWSPRYLSLDVGVRWDGLHRPFHVDLHIGGRTRSWPRRERRS